MTDAEAQALLNVSRETIERLEAFAAFLREENRRQNLVSRGSLEHLWQRHILDSAQLLPWAAPGAETWLDLGTGAGFPGLVAALLHPAHFTLVEARRLRVDFLRRGAEVLGISHKVEILCSKLEAVPPRAFAVISARAFAPMERLLPLAAPFSRAETVWLLPKGRNAKTELEAARRSWQGDFRLERSLTDADAFILVARGVRRRAEGKKGR